MQEYVKPPDYTFKTTGLLFLFKKYLLEEYGEHSVEDLNRYIESKENAELWCSRCGNSYSLDSFGEDLDIEWRLKEDDSIGPLNITKKGHESYFNPKGLGATCESDFCTEYNLPLEYLLVGEPRTEALIDFEIILLDTDKWKTKTYMKGLECRSDLTSLKYLCENGFAIEKDFILKNTWVKAYKLNKKGGEKAEEISDVLFDGFSILTQFNDFVGKRLDSLEEHVKNYDILSIERPKFSKQAKITEYPSTSKVEVVHIPEKKVEKIWKKDYKNFWGE